MNPFVEEERPSRTMIVLAAAVLIMAALCLAACGTRDGAPEATTAEAARPTEAIVRRPTEMPEVMVTATLPGQMVLETEHFAIYAGDDFPIEDIERWAAAAESFYARLNAEMGAQSREEIILVFQPPQDRPCPVRGTALFAESGPHITVFADEKTAEAQILGVLAHEVAHVVHITGFDRSLDGDRILNEGLATWITRDQWTAWHQTESLDEMVRGYLAAGDYVSLVEDVRSAFLPPNESTPADCLALRDLLYTEWAAFIGYLVDAYGWDAFVSLMASAAPPTAEDVTMIPLATDYEGVYGKTLEALEADWLARLQTGS